MAIRMAERVLSRKEYVLLTETGVDRLSIYGYDEDRVGLNLNPRPEFLCTDGAGLGWVGGRNRLPPR